MKHFIKRYAKYKLEVLNSKVGYCELEYNLGECKLYISFFDRIREMNIDISENSNDYKYVFSVSDLSEDEEKKIIYDRLSKVFNQFPSTSYKIVNIKHVYMLSEEFEDLKFDRVYLSFDKSDGKILKRLSIFPQEQSIEFDEDADEEEFIEKLMNLPK